MPRYFFHLASENIHVPDNSGREFSCAEDACLHARKMIFEALSYLDDNDGRWILRVHSPDESLEVIVLFPLRQVQHKITVSATMADRITMADAFFSKTEELEAKARVATGRDKAILKELAAAYRRLAARPWSLAPASDAEIEALATRVNSQSCQSDGDLRQPIAQVPFAKH